MLINVSGANASVFLMKDKAPIMNQIPDFFLHGPQSTGL